LPSVCFNVKKLKYVKVLKINEQIIFIFLEFVRIITWNIYYIFVMIYYKNNFHNYVIDLLVHLYNF